MNRDPIGEEGGLNLYGFTNNQPITSFDSLGNVTIAPVFNPAIGAAGVLVGVVAACAYPQFEAAFDKHEFSSDKFKHCWVSCRISKTCGGAVTELAGVAKEVRDRAVAAFCSIAPAHPLCEGGHGDFWDSLEDIAANNKCIGWGSIVFGPIGGWIGSACRESCEDCCRREVGYY